MTLDTIKAAAVASLVAVAVPLGIGCEAQGPAERTGEKIDRGIQDVKDTVNPPGPVEKAGRTIDRALDH